ncbi:MAG: DUF4124 domain-containing protein [Myxococcota bacterium]
MPPWIATLLSLATWALLASPAGAEFYRWRDASGAEHFTQHLHEVPPGQREAAKAAARAREADGANVTWHATPRREPTVGASVEAREAAPPAARAPSAGECRMLQKEARKKRKVIRTHQGSVDANLQWADDITRSAYARRRSEVRAEEESRWLARAQADLESFLETQRRRGVEPGCLR